MNRCTPYALLALGSAMFLLTLNAQTASGANLVGKWKLNTAKSQYQGAPRPSEATMVISQAAASHFKFRVTTAYTAGGETHWTEMSFDGAIDGRSYSFKTSSGRGSQLSFVDNNGILEGTAEYPGGETIHETNTVSSDGNTMISQSTLSGPKGPASWTEVWERIPDKKQK